MKRLAFAAALSLVCGSMLVFAQGQSGGRANVPDNVQLPDSSIEQPGDRGVNAHTNHLLLVRPQEGKPQNGLGPNGGMSPAQIISAYGLGSVANPGSGTIYIVDAFHYPTAVNDFNVFAGQFQLPVEPGDGSVFQVVYQGGKKPRTNCGWAQEAALDIEWAHAMAPNAKIVLIEAQSNSFSNLLAAVDLATAGSQVSMSWGGSEFSSEASYDTHFADSKAIVFVAASGDTGGKTIYPGVSPRVIAAGGTRLDMNGTSFVKETGWSGSGGGKSAYEGRPQYQDVIQGIVGTKRGVPDWSSDADPNTGVSVYDSTSCQGLSGWLVFGGTSVASPTIAGIINAFGTGANTSGELAKIYASLTSSGPAAYFRDITAGSAGSFSATDGWDFVTGIGSTNGTGGK